MRKLVLFGLITIPLRVLLRSKAPTFSCSVSPQSCAEAIAHFLNCAL